MKLKLKYIVLECCFDCHADIWDREERYHIRIIELDQFEESEIHHNPYYMILGTEERLIRWIKECYTYDIDDQNEIIQNLKDLEE